MVPPFWFTSERNVLVAERCILRRVLARLAEYEVVVRSFLARFLIILEHREIYFLAVDFKIAGHVRLPVLVFLQPCAARPVVVVCHVIPPAV